MPVKMNIESAFLEAAREGRTLVLFDQYRLSNSSNSPAVTASLENLRKALTSLNRVLLRAHAFDIEYLMDRHYTELARLKFTLTTHVRAKSDPGIRSLHDKIFRKHLRFDSQSQVVPRGVTRIFEEFIKGITYFQNQQQEQLATPIYHRLSSCGPSADDDKHRADHLICSKVSQTAAERARRRALTERCYLERLIFDALYRHEALHFPVIGTELASQNSGHLERLSTTQEDYESCFKDHSMEVTITYDDSMPCTLNVVRMYKDRILSEEIYTKTFSFSSSSGNKVFDPFISCIRRVLNATNGNVSTYGKVQTFADKRRWRPMH